MKKQVAPSISKAQLEVWEWKEKAAASVVQLPVGERVQFIMERAKKTSEKLLQQQKTSKTKKTAALSVRSNP